MARREQWKPTPGFDGYDVSDRGRVRSWLRGGGAKVKRKKPKLKTAWPNEHGRLRVALWRKKQVFRYVHRLVLEAFVGPCPEGMECCHGDDNYTNNRLGNLRWDTRLANCQDAGRTGVRAKGERCGSAKLKEGQVLAIYSAWHERDVPYSKLMEKYGVVASTISNICNGKTWDWLTGHSKRNGI